MRARVTRVSTLVIAGVLLGTWPAADLAASAPGRASTNVSLARDFTPRAVSTCLRRAPLSTEGIVFVTTSRDPRRGSRGRTVVQYALMPTDYWLPGMTIVFAANRADTARLRRAASRLAASGRFVVRSRANVFFYYERSTLPELVRNTSRCLRL